MSIPHGPDAAPHNFETMVFAPKATWNSGRYWTVAEARLGHARTVMAVMTKYRLPPPVTGDHARLDGETDRQCLDRLLAHFTGKSHE
jgi:hypothetical protein